MFDFLHVAQGQYKCLRVALAVPQEKYSENKKGNAVAVVKIPHFCPISRFSKIQTQ